MATCLDRAIRATPRLICKVGRSKAAGCVSGCNWAIASRFDGPGASSDGSGTEDCAAEGSMTAAGVMVGLLVSRTTFSGHLRSDLIRMITLSVISGRSGKLGGGSGRDQPAIIRRTASTLPTTIKYLTIGTADGSRDFSNPGPPMAATLDQTHVARKSNREPGQRTELPSHERVLVLTSTLALIAFE
jgi:hypothetical protein